MKRELLFTGLVIVIVTVSALVRSAIKIDSSVKKTPNLISELDTKKEENSPEDNQHQEVTEAPEEKIKKEDQNMQEDLLVDTSNWGNYTDRSNGLTLSYPNGWTVKDRSGTKNGQKYSYKWFVSKERKESSEYKADTDYDLGIILYDSNAYLPQNSENLSFEEWVTQKSKDYGFLEPFQVTVAGKTGYQGRNSRGETIYFVKNSGRIFEIKTFTNDSLAQRQVGEQILKTLRFI